MVGGRDEGRVVGGREGGMDEGRVVGGRDRSRREGKREGEEKGGRGGGRHTNGSCSEVAKLHQDQTHYLTVHSL